MIMKFFSMKLILVLQNHRPRYNWNIVESGVKHPKPKSSNQNADFISSDWMFLEYEFKTCTLKKNYYKAWFGMG